MTVIISHVINLFSIFVFDIGFHVITFWVNFHDDGDVTLDINSRLVVSAEHHEFEDERPGKWAVLLSNCTSRHVTLYRYHQIQVNLISYRFLIDN